MRMQIKSVLSLLLLGEMAVAAPYFSDTSSAYAKQTIVRRLQIKKVSDLNFGEASPGDGPKIVSPGTSESRENASFEVVGEPQRYFQIILPQKNSVKMKNGLGGLHREILIQEFSSYPARTGTLGPSGKSMIYVGAKREAISAQQKTGDYVGQFFVTVVY